MTYQAWQDHAELRLIFTYPYRISIANVVIKH